MWNRKEHSTHTVEITEIYSHTVWEFRDFCGTQILREINSGKSRSAETAIFAIFGALNSVNLVNSSLQKVQKFVNSKFTASRCVKIAYFALRVSKLISRKIWVTEKSWNHTVTQCYYDIGNFLYFSSFLVKSACGWTRVKVWKCVRSSGLVSSLSGKAYDRFEDLSSLWIRVKVWNCVQCPLIMWYFMKKWSNLWLSPSIQTTFVQKYISWNQFYLSINFCQNC